MQYLVALLLAAATAQAHYTFPKLVINGVTETDEWSSVRKTKNWNTNSPMNSVTSADFRCNQLSTGPKVATVQAGGTVGFTTSQQFNHPGPFQYYMAKVPSGGSVSSWDGSGSVWVKVATGLPSIDANKQMTWPGQNTYATAPFTVPKALPSGDYLLRGEHLALHQATTSGGVQIYVACAQITVTGGGSGSPGPAVAFPGAYQQNDPGILVDINKIAMSGNASSYKPPGPAVWTG